VQVRVGAEVGRASNLYLGKLPLLIEASPARGQAGDRVTVRGRGLDPTPGATTLSFGNAQALVLSTTPTEVVAIVPGLSEGQVVLPISATVHGAISSGVVRYTLARPASTTFVPRFFAAPVTDAGHAGHDHALVANELGPVLLLSGKADAPSTAERAERAATALNTVTEALLAGKTGGVELQDKPAPGLSATGGASPFVTATAADVAGYQESWEASAPRPSRYGPRELVGYWAALLQDELALFAKRQRPAALIELSPRAKIFNDLYAEAARRVGRGGGVPLAVVSPLTPTLARGFHDLAFLLPTEAARPGAAVEGRWSGTMVEGEAGQRNVDLKLRSQSGGLGGTMTATSGKLAMEIPLKEASYEKGTLRFVLVVGGAPKHFVGNVEGDAISGTIHASADAKEAIGRFSLKYTQ